MRKDQEADILRINREVGHFLNNKIKSCSPFIKNLEGFKLFMENLKGDLKEIERRYALGFSFCKSSKKQRGER